MILTNRVLKKKMNKRIFMTNLASVCDDLGINRREVTIAAGGASLIWDMRDSTNDIDVYVGKHILDEIRTHPDAIVSHLDPIHDLPGCEVISIRGVDFHDDSYVRRYPTCNYRKFKVQSRTGLLSFRIAMSREKDKADLEALKPYWVTLTLQQRFDLISFLAGSKPHA